ncbi:MAG: flippase-like domain-containing protein [Chloroflexi bacterium]|nr:flippase-like domain-containing protein [Chloroflexota bacterium]
MSQFLKIAKRWLPGALVSILLIAAILYFVDIPKMIAAIRSADYRFIALALVLSFAWLAVRGIVWRTLLRNRVPYREVFNALNAGYLLNAFLPFRLGEIGRAFLLSRKTDLQFAEILPTVVIERSMDLAFTASIFLASLPFVAGASGANRIAIILGAVVLVGLIFLYVLARNDAWALDTFHKFSARWPAIQRFGGGLLESFLTGLGVLTNGWLFARFLFWMALNWGMAIISYYLTIRAFFPQAQLTWGMFGLGAAAFGGAVPSLPGAVGTFEGAFGGALTLLTGDQSTSLAVALTARFFNYLTSLLLGGYALSREGQTLSGIYRQLMNLRLKPEPTDVE